WGSALHRVEGRCLSRTPGKVRVDDDRTGDGGGQQREDPVFEVETTLPEHRHERGARQGLTRAQDVQLHRLRARPRQVGTLEGYLAHGDHGSAGTGKG